MNQVSLLKWAEIGFRLINELGIPIADVIKLFRDSGGSDEQCLELIQRWADLHGTVADRVEFLKIAINALP